MKKLFSIKIGFHLSINLETLFFPGPLLFTAACVSGCHFHPSAPLQEPQSPGIAAISLNFVDFVKVKVKASLSLEFLLTYIIT